MQVEFYTVLDNNKVINKTLGSLNKACQCQVYDDCSIMNPRLLLEYSSIIVNSNYFYIPLWNRYYFIKQCDGIPGNRMIVTGREDCLMSNAADIMKLKVYALRGTSSRREPYLSDGQYPEKVKRNCNTIAFPSTVFNNSTGFSYIMTVVGGKKMQ